ncbi:MAG: AAA family ATPase [Muribaculaceae bacterium]|nr:AAA family ATPase [Muribaculaceae bacterium]MBQ4138485.1 AAA family ATPase [Muribaculaceae bacterium]
MSQAVSPILLLQKQKILLQKEYEAERDEFRRQTETVGIRRKVKRGDCWFPLRVGRHYYNSLNQLVVEVFRDEDTEIEHNFEYGRQVMFFDIDVREEIHYLPFTSTVSYAEETRMVIVLTDPAHLDRIAACTHLGVQLSFDETTHRLMMEALDRVIKAKGNRLAQLRDLFYNHSRTEEFTFDPIRFPWLNSTQEAAVNRVLRAKDVAIVHGPPGTGKTTTLVEAIYETLRRENQVLVCAQSNMAVDWISERLVDRGVEVLRLGNPARVNDKMLSFTYERRFESHPDYPQLWAIRKAIRELQAQRKRSNQSFHDKLDRLKSRATELEMRINNELMGTARVIACTLAGSANRLLDGMKFATLFIDEAAQALEAACWIAMRRANRLILAGDHQQLPPTVKSIEALQGGLGETLMERIVKSNPQVVTLLQVQYRMNDAIMHFSSEWFYDGRVQSAPDVKFRSILDLDTPIVWIDTDGMDMKEEFVGENYGRINKGEAQLTLETLHNYFERIGRQRMLDERLDVGIISPYRAQVQYLRRQIRHDDYFKPFRNAIAVNTVDGFQGQERDIIVISLVRANDDGQIGFLRDLRRMNVAITRARMKLIILGDTSTLTRHPFYRKLHQYIQQLSLNQ